VSLLLELKSKQASKERTFAERSLRAPETNEVPAGEKRGGELIMPANLHALVETSVAGAGKTAERFTYHPTEAHLVSFCYEPRNPTRRTKRAFVLERDSPVRWLPLRCPRNIETGELYAARESS
jgi:hypothetical protein